MYEFHKRHLPYPHDLTEWEQAATDVCEVAAKYQNDPFILDMLTAVYNELERAYKGRETKCAQ